MALTHVLNCYYVIIFNYFVNNNYFFKIIIIFNKIFSPDVKQASHLQALLPSRITSTTSVRDISEAVKLYNDNFPNPIILDEELHVCKTKWHA